MDIFNKFFLEKEIKDVLGVLDELSLEFKDYAYFENVRDLVKKIILKNKNEIIKIINEQNISPRRTACSWINNVAGDSLEGGQYHVYRGVLNFVGEAYLKIYDKSTDILLEVGEMSKESAEQHKQDIRACIKRAG